MQCNNCNVWLLNHWLTGLRWPRSWLCWPGQAGQIRASGPQTTLATSTSGTIKYKWPIIYHVIQYHKNWQLYSNYLSNINSQFVYHKRFTPKQTIAIKRPHLQQVQSNTNGQIYIRYSPTQSATSTYNKYRQKQTLHPGQSTTNGLLYIRYRKRDGQINIRKSPTQTVKYTLQVHTVKRPNLL